MRTLWSLDKLKEYASALEGRKQNRKYDVSGSIVFRLVPGVVNPDINFLRGVIVATDKLFPWKDYTGIGELRPSIKYLTDGEVVVHNFHLPEKVCWFYIHPPFPLNKGQLHAYEMYLEKIAEVISSRRFGSLRS